MVAAPFLLPAAASAQGSPSNAAAALDALVTLFAPLGGQFTALVVVDDPAGGWQIDHESSAPRFVGSAIKTFILGTYLLEVEGGRASLDEQLPVNDEVRSLVSPVLDKLNGTMAARSVLEAMITHSDNTATDIALKRIGVDAVRAVIARSGIPVGVSLPTSTRRMISYIAGAPPGGDVGWNGMLAIAGDRFPGTPRPIINGAESMMAPASALVAWYRHVLSGHLFSRAETLAELKRVSAMASGLAPIVPPDTAVYGKGGSIVWLGQNALAVGGQMVIRGKTATFGFTLNWQGDQNDVPNVTLAMIDGARRVLAAVAARMV